MWNVLFVFEGNITQLGPFKSEQEADNAAIKAQRLGVIDIEMEMVYLMRPDGQMIEYCTEDLCS